MTQYILRRLALLVPVLFGVSLVVFTLVRLIPGDATLLAIGVDQRITPEQREAMRRSYGLDQPQPVQYVKWMGHVLRGDLGSSLRTRRSLTEELRLRLPVTVELTLLAALIGAGPALAAGVARRGPPQLGARLCGDGGDAGRRLGAELPAGDAARPRLLLLAALAAADRLRRAGAGDPLQNLKTMILPAVSLACRWRRS